MSDGSVVDIALMVADKPSAAVAIKVTHVVARRLAIPYIELEGEAVIDNPAMWKPTIDRFKPFNCERCKANYCRFRAKVEQLARATKVEVPTAYYRTCHFCMGRKRKHTMMPRQECSRSPKP